VVEFDEKGMKLNGADDYPTAHNGLVAGSSPAGPTKNINVLFGLRCLQRDDRTSNRTRYVRFSFVHRFTKASVKLTSRSSATKILALQPTEAVSALGDDVGHLR